MKAMILAAGLGTRLLPLTEEKPKVLMPVVNKPVIGRVVEYLKRHGIRSIVVNVHHHSQQVINYLDGGRPFGMEIAVRVEPEILGTGGGIKNTEDFWDNELFVVMNGDILTDIDLHQACEAHRKAGGLVTLILHNCEPYNQIQVGDKGIVTGIAQESAPGRLAFTGIHIMEPDLLSYIPEGEYSDIIDCYRRLIESGGMMKAHISTGHYWRDMGTVDNYVKVNKELLGEESLSVGSDSLLDPSVKIEEWAIVGEKNRLEKDVEIRRSILWDEVRVKEGEKVIDSIVTSCREVNRDLIGEIY
jgi:NDP-sugar pyrophosphorylase family protein